MELNAAPLFLVNSGCSETRNTIDLVVYIMFVPHDSEAESLKQGGQHSWVFG